MSNMLVPYIDRIIEVIIQPLVQLLFFAAFIVFAWGIMIMILNAADETKRSEGKKHMMYGIIGMLIMIGSYGIFSILENTVFETAGVEQTSSILKR